MGCPNRHCSQRHTDHSKHKKWLLVAVETGMPSRNRKDLMSLSVRIAVHQKYHRRNVNDRYQQQQHQNSFHNQNLHIPAISIG